MASIPPSTPLKFPSSGFVEIETKQQVEEEEIPNYRAENYYPVHIGEIFDSRYQIISKLGFGVNSTVWLCRDYREDRYLTLKFRVRGNQSDHMNVHDDHEIAVSDYLNDISTDHPGRKMVRTVSDSFDVLGPHGSHKVLLYAPLGMSFTELLDLLPGHRMSEELFKNSIKLLLIALDYLHYCNVVHTDVSPNNILQALQDHDVLTQIERSELETPIARKVLNDRTIYLSRPIPPTSGLPILCDLGEARIGTETHTDDIMPGIYRAPEVILGMNWNSKVDIWSVGVMGWGLLQGGNLFFAKQNGLLHDEQHLAEMVSLLGPPPSEFLARSEKCQLYWDDRGNWRGSIPIPDQSFEMRERQLSGAERTSFLKFMRRVLRWIPEERPRAEELAFDDFLCA